jgi:predicted AAA+ superfamily ATPase
MLLRKSYINLIDAYSSIFPICAVIGPRQVGKTTLALEYAKKFTNVVHFDLEDPVDFEKLQNPKQFLPINKELIIIDEIQKSPHLFSYLRVFVDKNPTVFILILGSSSPDLTKQSGESLAGRIGYIELTPFSLTEVNDLSRLWSRGGYPKAYLAQTNNQALLWIKNYIASFLERDLALLGFGVDGYLMRKLWMMVAHYHANLVNYSELGRSLNLSEPTIKKYLSILEKTFMVRLLAPWHENIAKRQVKQPKIYIRDSGILHYLLGVTAESLEYHPKLGASWEGFGLEEVIRCHQAQTEDCYFWRTQDGAELDLLIVLPGKKLGFEFKLSEQTQMTPSMRIALEDLKLDQLTVITSSQSEPYRLNEKVEVISLEHYIQRFENKK